MSVILKNLSGIPVLAYALRWEWVSAGGIGDGHYASFGSLQSDSTSFIPAGRSAFIAPFGAMVGYRPTTNPLAGRLKDLALLPGQTSWVPMRPTSTRERPPN